MSEKDENNDEGAIFRVDTVPPPAGESDAYNAPTKVGAMADSVMQEMMHATQLKVAELRRHADEAARPPAAKSTPAVESRPPRTESPPSAPKTAPKTDKVADEKAGPTASESNQPTARKASVAGPASVPSKSPATPSTGPQAPLPARAAPAPRPAPADEVTAPPAPKETAPPRAAPSPSEAPSAPTASSATGEPGTSESPGMPSLHDEDEDLSDADAFAPTQLHAQAKPPSGATPQMQPIPPTFPTDSTARPRQGSPIPFHPSERVRAPEGVSLLPLAVGFGVFFFGLLLYLLVR